MPQLSHTSHGKSQLSTQLGPPELDAALGFPHESIEVYVVSLGIARRARAQLFPPRGAALADQAIRASLSIVPHFAEGAARCGAAGKHHSGVALGRAAEMLAVLDGMDLPEGAARKVELKRVGAMLPSPAGARSAAARRAGARGDASPPPLRNIRVAGSPR